jgi:5-methylcytosine-specific restriction protein A
LFTGPSGEQHGYRDGFQSDGTYWYTGEGQVGDMEMVRGNRAIRDAAAAGRTIHLFEETRPTWVRYVGVATYLGQHASPAPDRTGKTRIALVFELEVSGDAEDSTPANLRVDAQKTTSDLRTKSLAQLRELALAPSPTSATPTQRRANVYRRSRAVHAYVLRRANGVCEGCGHPAPFETARGELYLEPHHITRRADGGPDHPRWVAALCPNCHRRVEYGKDGKLINEAISARIGAMEEAS